MRKAIIFLFFLVITVYSIEGKVVKTYEDIKISRMPGSWLRFETKEGKMVLLQGLPYIVEEQ